VVDDVQHAPVTYRDAPVVLVAFQFLGYCGPWVIGRREAGGNATEARASCSSRSASASSTICVAECSGRRANVGDMIVVRYADDAVLGFQYREDAERFLKQLQERMGKFGLELHPEKTRLIEFGRYATERRAKRGEGKPETFNFLVSPTFVGRASPMAISRYAGKRSANVWQPN